MSRTLMLVAVLVSHLCAQGFAAALRNHFPLTDTESDQDNLYGSIGSLIRRSLIHVRVPMEHRSVRSDYEDPGDLAFATAKRKKDLEELDRTRIRFLHRLYSSISNEGDPKTQRMFVGKRNRNTYATALDRTPNDCGSIGRGPCCSNDRLPVTSDEIR